MGLCSYTTTPLNWFINEDAICNNHILYWNIITAELSHGQFLKHSVCVSTQKQRMHIHVNTQFTYVNCVKAQERKWRWEKHYISTKTNPELKPNRRIPRNQKSNKNCIQKKGKRKSNNKNFMILLCHRFDNKGRRRKQRGCGV